MNKKMPIILFLLLLVPLLARAQSAASVSEKDFFSDMPIVLSVSRLPQRLDETPGAVTILDRRTIRMSGARDVVDLLRLVPGFSVTNSFESNTPQGSYHGNWGDYANHVQVMVDGRSVYSPFLLGSTGPGLQTVAIDDIERIEVLRGSNSAAYGARAFLGTINIVTGDPLDTLGAQASLASGDNGIQDMLARIGWGDDQASFRMSLDQRADGGLDGAGGRARVSRANFRGDIRPTRNDEVGIRLGQALIDAAVGFADQEGNALRNRVIDTSFLQLDWRRNLGADEDLALQFSHMKEATQDGFPYLPVPGMRIDFGGRASNDHVSLQHSLRKGSDVRLVWGGELRQERVASRPLFSTDAEFKTDFARLFTNVEWRMRPDWVLNAGGMFERSSLSGEHLSPRLALHWHLAPGHSLRYGLSRAYRPPSIYEKSADVRYYANGTLLDITHASRGKVQSEGVLAREIGYLGNFPSLGLSADVRVFQEEVRDFIRFYEYPMADGLLGNGRVFDFRNGENFNIRGVEYQLKWKPWERGQLVFGHAYVDSGWTDGGTFIQDEIHDLRLRPRHSAHLMWMQEFASGWQFTLQHHYADATNFPGVAEPLAPAMHRTDLRLAKALRVGSRRGEVSLVVQNLGAAYPDFIPAFQFRRQAYLMLRLEN